MLLIFFPLKKTAALGFTARLTLKAGSLYHTPKETMLTSNVEIVNHLLEIYITKDKTTGAEPEILRSIQQTSLLSLPHAYAPRMKSLH